MPSRLYEINHPYSLARALLAAVKKAVAAGDEEVMAPWPPKEAKAPEAKAPLAPWPPKEATGDYAEKKRSPC